MKILSEKFLMLSISVEGNAVASGINCQKQSGLCKLCSKECILKFWFKI